MQVSLDRPVLMPPSSEQQMQPEYVSAELDLNRKQICHPLAGIYSDDDWKEFKDECALHFVAHTDQQ
jgi:hypothetical protein